MDDKKRIATRHWLEKANHDLLSAKVLLREMPILTDSICFHYQQAAFNRAEKVMAFVKGKIAL